MNESEQAQAIAEIKKRQTSHFANNMEMHGLMKFVDSLREDYVTALKIVDSQAQKIVEQAEKIKVAITQMDEAAEWIKKQDTKIAELETEVARQKGKTKTVYQLCRNSVMFSRRIRAEQAKEIERLKDRLRFEMQPEAKEGL